MVRVALEATSICKSVHTGIQKYIVDLLAAMSGAGDDGLELTALYKWSHRRHGSRCVNGAGLRNWWYVGNGLPVAKRFDVAHVLDMRCPAAPGARYVTTVYDLAVLLDEHQFDAYSSERFRRRKRAKYERLFDKSDAVVAISERTKRDVVEVFGYPQERVRVIYPGLTGRVLTPPNPNLGRAVMEKYRLTPKGYCLFVGPPNERKNVDRLIDGFMMSGASGQHQLILAGNPGYTDDAIRLRLENRTISQHVRFIGYVPDHDLPALYRNARAFLFPTLYEGFGLPILEALACGTPAVIGNRGAAPEVGGVHAIQVDPFSVESIAEGIDRTVEGDAFDAAAARDWALSFDWEKAARAHLNLYRDVAG